MATSGRINGTALNGGSSTGLYAFWADWTRNGEYNIVNNTSNITVYLRVQRVDGSSAGAYAYDVAPSVSLSVGGSARVPSISYIDTRNQVVCTFATWTGDVKHNPDGSPNCPIVASFTHYGSSTLGGGTLSGSADLDTIPQATSFDNLTCSTGYFTGTMTALYTPKASTLYNRFRMEFVHNGSLIHLQDVDFGTRPTTQQVATMVLDGDSLETIYNLLTTEPASGALRITLRTYSDAGYSNQVGNASFRMLTLSVPDSKDTKPAVTMSLSPVSSLPDAFNGLYIQGKTKVKASTFLATPQYGTSITSSGISVQGANYYAKDDYTSGYLTQYGSVTVTGFATDARGFTGNAPLDIDVIPYGKPKVLNVVAGRCDVDGNMSDSGTYLKINATRDYSPVAVGGVQKNFCAIQYRVRTSGGQYPDSWQTILDRTASGNTVASQPLMSGGLNKKTSYMVQIRVVDDIGESSDTEVSIPTEDVYMHRAKDAMGLGKYVEHDGLDMGWDIHMNGNRVTGLPEPANDTDAVPWGSVNGKFAPSGFGLGDGSTYIDDCNAVGANGWYFGGASTANRPCDYFTLLHFYRTASEANQLAFDVSGNNMYFRFKVSGDWSAWAEVNPYNFAPAGYGLGVAEPTQITDLNTATKSGWYKFGNNAANAPDAGSYWMYVSAFSPAYIYQEVYNDTYKVILSRWLRGDGWSPWEWVNPSMHLNTEYRTTERFFAKSVYKYVLDVGYLGAGVNSFNHGIANIDECVGIEMINEGFGLFTAHCDAEFSQTGIYLNMPWAAGAVKLILAYTKN